MQILDKGKKKVFKCLKTARVCIPGYFVPSQFFCSLRFLVNFLPTSGSALCNLIKIDRAQSNLIKIDRAQSNLVQIAWVKSIVLLRRTQGYFIQIDRANIVKIHKLAVKKHKLAVNTCKRGQKSIWTGKNSWIWTGKNSWMCGNKLIIHVLNGQK